MTIQGIRSVLAVPLGVGDHIIGLIYADSPLAEAGFTEDHLKVLTTLGSVAAIRVQNARLLEEHLERDRFERELQLAREIQQRFQPTAPPTLNGYEMQGISFPSYESAATTMIIERRMVDVIASATCRARTAAAL